jgi:hypothetical protein
LLIFNLKYFSEFLDFIIKEHNIKLLFEFLTEFNYNFLINLFGLYFPAIKDDIVDEDGEIIFAITHLEITINSSKSFR